MGDSVRKQINLRKAVFQDMDDIFSWRNDLETRKQSFNPNPISYSEHRQWFKKILKSPKHLLYLAVDQKGEKCGVARIDIKNRQVAEININVAPTYRGKGIGEEMTSQVTKKLFSKRKIRFLLARVKEKNIPSLKLFSKIGFFEIFDYVDKKAGKVIVLGYLNLGK